MNKCKPRRFIYHYMRLFHEQMRVFHRVFHEIEHNWNMMPTNDCKDFEGGKSSFAWLQELFIALSGMSLTSSMPAE